MRGRYCQTTSDKQDKKIIKVAVRPLLSDIDGVKPKKIDTRMDARLYELVDSYARAHSLTRSQVVVAAVRQYFGISPSNPVAFAQGKTTPQNEPVGAEILKASASFATGSSTATPPCSLKTGSDKSTI